MVSSAPTILRPWVQIAGPFHDQLFSILESGEDDGGRPDRHHGPIRQSQGTSRQDRQP